MPNHNPISDELMPKLIKMENDRNLRDVLFALVVGAVLGSGITFLFMTMFHNL